ncbi:MAG: AraC family transcriptional regulator [Gammaproteobacteria bacterium]
MTRTQTFCHIVGALCVSLVASVALAQDAMPLKNLDSEAQDLKKELLALNRDLFILEEELLYPANTQVAVFVSLDVGEFFGLDSMELKLDGKNVSNYLYTEKEVDALHRGGVQRLFVGNLKAGEHELVAVLTGKGPHDRDYRRGTTLKFEKALGAKYLELQIRDSEKKLQPQFLVKEWD